MYRKCKHRGFTLNKKTGKSVMRKYTTYYTIKCAVHCVVYFVDIYPIRERKACFIWHRIL